MSLRWRILSECVGFLEDLVRAAVSRHIAQLPAYPTVHVERGGHNDVMLVWSEKVPIAFQFQVSQAVYTHYIGYKMTQRLLDTIASHANSVIVRRVNRGDLCRCGLAWLPQESFYIDDMW